MDDRATTSGTTTRRAPGAPALAAELRVAVMRTSRRLRLESTDQISPGQFSVLAVLDRQGPSTPRELAVAEHVQPPSMTRTIGLLEELGLVARTDHPTDGRQVLMSLTDAGRATIRETRRRRDAWLAKRLAELEPHERATLQEAAAILLRVSDR
ncbi:MarR family winged helix-turn-helix transcriptional regulator [Angustibacter aerolatus]